MTRLKVYENIYRYLVKEMLHVCTMVLSDSFHCVHKNPEPLVAVIFTPGRRRQHGT